MKINCKIAKVKTTKFEMKKIEYVIKKKKYKTIIKQLQIDNVVFRKIFFLTTSKNKKKRNNKYSNSSKFKHNIDQFFYEI